MIREALDALTGKPMRCTTLERVRLSYEAHHALPELPQPLKFGLGLKYVLERISLPVKATDLLVGLISEEIPDEEGEAFFNMVAEDPAFDFIRGERLETLKKLAAEKGVAPNVLQLAWMLHSWRFADRSLIVPLFSASSTAHLEENLSAAGVSLTTEEAALLNEA